MSREALIGLVARVTVVQLCIDDFVTTRPRGEPMVEGGSGGLGVTAGGGAAILALVAVAAACSQPSGPADGGADPFRSIGAVKLEGAVGSLEQLAFETLEGLADRDTDRLQRIRLTEYEHNQLVWPELPASAPEVNFPVDFAWTNISLRNHRALVRLFHAYGGQRMTLLAIECRLEPETFPSFTVHKDCWVKFRRDREPPAWQQFFRYALDWDGQYKIFRFYDPD